MERFSQLESGPAGDDGCAAGAGTGGPGAAPSTCRPDDAILDLGLRRGQFHAARAAGFSRAALSPRRPEHADARTCRAARARTRARRKSVADPSPATCAPSIFPTARFPAILAGRGASSSCGRKPTGGASSPASIAWLKPGGRLYVADLVCFDLPGVQEMMWERYGRYLEGAQGPRVPRESLRLCRPAKTRPRSLPFQLELLRTSGFASYRRAAPQQRVRVLFRPALKR